MDNTIEAPKKKRGAPVGHGRYGGRGPGSLSRTTWDLLQKSEQLGADPLAVHHWRSAVRTVSRFSGVHG